MEGAFPARPVRLRVNLRLEPGDLAIPLGEGGRHAESRATDDATGRGREVPDDGQERGFLGLDRTRGPREPAG